jgi:hypothetical protein
LQNVFQLFAVYFISAYCCFVFVLDLISTGCERKEEEISLCVIGFLYWELAYPYFPSGYLYWELAYPYFPSGYGLFYA